MLAGGVTVVAATLNFRNGGGGFSGYNGSLVHIPQIRRPSFAGPDPAYYPFCVIVAIIMFLLVYVAFRTRPGRAGASVRQSEAASLAAGISTTFYKLWAMALASFVTGVAGALLAGGDRYLYSIDFPIQNSIPLLAVGVMQVVAAGPGGIADQSPKDMKRLYGLIRRLVSRPAPASPSGAASAKEG